MTKSQTERPSPVKKPVMEAMLGQYRLTFADVGVRVDVTRINDDGEAEVYFWHVTGGQPVCLYGSRIGLLSPVSTDRVVKRLERSGLPIDWDSVLNYTTIMSLQELRRGAPLMELDGEPQAKRVAYLIEPFLMMDEVSSLYAPGGSAKSTMANLVAVMVSAGVDCLGWRTNRSGNVLYLDYEHSFAHHQRYVWAIKRGLGVQQSPHSIVYRHCDMPFAAESPEILRIVKDRDIVLVIIDSQMAAAANTTDMTFNASRFYSAARGLGVTVLVIDHVAKTDWRTGEAAVGPIGSTVKWNASRCQWEIQKTQEPGSDFLEIALIHRKQNEGRIQKPIGVRIEYDTDIEDNLKAIRFKRFDLAENAELERNKALWERIADRLRYGPRTLAQLAEELDKPKPSIKTELYRRSDKYVRLPDDRWALRYMTTEGEF